MKKAKKFDCVEMKNEIQAKIYEEIKDLTPQEEIAYRRKKLESGSMGEFYKKLRAKSKRGKKTAV